MKPFLILTLLLALSVSPLFGQSGPSFPGPLTGTWEGQGQLFGQTATFSMKWERTLEEQFLSLTFENSFSDDSGTERVMQARAFYNLNTGKGYWFDSRGQMLPLSFQTEGNTLTVMWGDDTTEQGKTIYNFADAEAEVQDFVYRKGEYVPFGSAVYQKKG